VRIGQTWVLAISGIPGSELSGLSGVRECGSGRNAIEWSQRRSRQEKAAKDAIVSLAA